MRRRISTKQAANLRQIVQNNRCAVRPGITHRWCETGPVILWPGDRMVQGYRCTKCGTRDPE